MAEKSYANAGRRDFTGAEFEQLLDSVCIGDDWNNPPVDHRTLVLMMMAALQFGIWVEQTVCPLATRAALEAVETQSYAHGAVTAGMIVELGNLANQLAATARR
ncbi:hypothetical protein MKK70_16730 [Methylobacterium sp. E-041]|uniref:hypothetical protein n=1 Tax=Methylobacterium sp. E-041 TaxID=2836573 RepID=UPI001FB940EC|nr:hypothetical protein [Methylobacterium sp. E-041]MCJ2106992.1 hypothetical protein [Methylobacterium sp. E-041]